LIVLVQPLQKAPSKHRRFIDKKYHGYVPYRALCLLLDTADYAVYVYLGSLAAALGSVGFYGVRAIWCTKGVDGLWGLAIIPFAGVDLAIPHMPFHGSYVLLLQPMTHGVLCDEISLADLNCWKAPHLDAVSDFVDTAVHICGDLCEGVKGFFF
jgi:hypothetical protein